MYPIPGVFSYSYDRVQRGGIETWRLVSFEAFLGDARFIWTLR